MKSSYNIYNKIPLGWENFSIYIYINYSSRSPRAQLKQGCIIINTFPASPASPAPEKYINTSQAVHINTSPVYINTSPAPEKCINTYPAWCV